MRKLNFAFSFVLIATLFFACSKSKNDVAGGNGEGDDKFPHISITYTPKNPVAEEEISFTATEDYGSSEITSWEWTFKSGSTSAEKDPKFAFDEEGTYTVELEGTDASGKSDKATVEITVGPKPAGEFQAAIAWEYSTGTAITAANDATAPAIGDNNRIYYLSSYAGGKAEVVSLTDQGNVAQKNWIVTMDARSQNAISIGKNGNLYFGFWAVDALAKLSASDGSILWQGSTGSGITNSSAAIASDGSIYVGTKNHASIPTVRAYNSDGSDKWAVSIGNVSLYSSPAISKDESTVYFLATNIKKFYAFKTSDGSEKWEDPVEIPDGDGTGTSISIDSDGTIYVTTQEKIVAINDNGDSGEIKWQADATGAESSGVVVGLNGDLYCGSSEGLVSLKADDGAINWIYDAVIDECVPAVDKNGNVYFGTIDGILNVVNPEGELLKSFTIGEGLVNSPIMDADGNVFVEVVDNEDDNNVIKLVKIAVDNSAPAPVWPMKGQNGKHKAVAQ